MVRWKFGQNVRLFSAYMVIWTGFFSGCDLNNRTDKPNLEQSHTFFIGTNKYRAYKVARNLNIPWEILWGPDGKIWFTQRNGVISRLDPESGSVRNLAKVENTYQWTSAGLLGMCLHPEFKTNPYLYVSYNYLDGNKNVLQRTVRYTYNKMRDTLLHPTPILDNLFTSLANYGSRLMITDDGKLLQTLGSGTKVFEESASVDTMSRGGIVLRLNLDGSIPEDNPYPNDPIFANGFRNSQGLVSSKQGILYSSDHGPAACDEINIIEGGEYYGWPYVLGACDSFPSMNETSLCERLRIREPIWEWTPTIAPCGLDYYYQDLIPEWKNSLLLVTLKESDLRVLTLSEDGRAITSETIYLDDVFGRLRDLCISPDGRIFYFNKQHRP